ncbi:phospholipase D family protein [Aquimarina longa]|uniref:phospholipase D family protein n=1 Tax=Aquimarina longa TaxID=1080221 RepID=UPI00078572CA|nr:phospholipase D family protein [Aquimarina longa]
MANFLTTAGTTNSIEQLILNAQSKLTLVTPYLKLSKTLRERIEYACKKNIKVTLIYGKSELKEREKKVLYELANVQIYFCENLHAKCYYNEDSLIITSMNLHEFSERYNREMGIELNRELDENIYFKAVEEVNSIRSVSVLEKDFENSKCDLKPLFIPKKDILKLDEVYMDKGNFYIPAFKAYFEMLSDKIETEIEDEMLIIRDFPKKNINLEIGYRIILRFYGDFDFNSYREQHIASISNGLEGIRFYWNPKRVCIYLEKKRVFEKTPEGLEKVMQYILSIIDKTIKNSNLVDKEVLLPME